MQDCRLHLKRTHKNTHNKLSSVVKIFIHHAMLELKPNTHRRRKFCPVGVGSAVCIGHNKIQGGPN